VLLNYFGRTVELGSAGGKAMKSTSRPIINQTSCSIRITLFVVAVLAALSLGACGGGGGDSGNVPDREDNFGVSIDSPTSNRFYQTDRPSLSLSGTTETISDARCSPPPVKYKSANYQITWTNQATGEKGAGVVGLDCSASIYFQFVTTLWNTRVPLHIGDNKIIVTANYEPIFTGHDTITITRIADQTAPTVTSVFPADGEIAISPRTAIQVFFSEEISDISFSTDFITLAAAGQPPVLTNFSLFNHYDSNDQVKKTTASFLPPSALASGTTYTITVDTRVRDVNGNPLANSFVSSFTTQ
jgi:hypothetical protein